MRRKQGVEQTQEEKLSGMGGLAMPTASDILAWVARYTPDVVLKRFPSVLLGVTVGYGSCLLFMGPLGFFYSILQLFITGAVVWALVNFARMGIERCSPVAERCLNDGVSLKRGVSAHTNDSKEDLD